MPKNAAFPMLSVDSGLIRSGLRIERLPGTRDIGDLAKAVQLRLDPRLALHNFLLHAQLLDDKASAQRAGQSS